SIGDEQANKLMLFAKIADDFRTPVTLVIGPLENALNEKYGKLSAEMKKHLQVIAQNARHLLRQINRFHDISKLQAGKMELKPARRNIVAFMKGIIQLFEETAQRRNVNLAVVCDRESIEVYFDPEKMDEVFYHLLANALKFTSNDGSVSVSFTMQQPTVEYPEGSVRISMKDTGKGITEDELGRLSEVVRRTDQAQEAGAQQYGLALVSELVFLHGGRMDVKSGLDKGTEFQIVLPLGRGHFADTEVIEAPESESMEVEEAAIDRKRVVDESRLPQNPENVLIVEDNPDIRELLKDCLKDYYHVTEATDGKDALEKASQTIPDMIISDILMPGMDGFDLCRTLKTDKALHHIPVILLTAKSSDLMRIQGIEAGADAYIAKPFSPEQLIEKLKSLSRQRAES
ncbi:MAG TPA: response regulator, partial [Acidobacteriota bacterium]